MGKFLANEKYQKDSKGFSTTTTSENHGGQAWNNPHLAGMEYRLKFRSSLVGSIHSVVKSADKNGMKLQV